MVRSGSTSSMGPKSPTSNCTMDKDSPEMDVLSTAIIETIRRIRSQKQRPSLERISKWVLNRTAARDCSFEDVVSRLEDLSSCGKILKVFNQGEYSYRDPETMTPRACGRASKSWKEAKHRHTPLSTPNPHKSPLSSPTSPKIASPELTLIPRNPLMRHRTLQVLDYIKLVQVSLEGLSQPEGATIKDMDRYLETTYFIQGISAIEFSRHLRLACKRLVNAGRLIKDGMIFRLAPNALPVSPEANKVTLASAKEDGNPSEAGSDPMRVCSYCRGTAQCNKDGVTEPLLSCIDCGHSGHPTCMKLSSELAAKVRNLQWQCIECKSCKVCSSKGNADNLLFCDSCDRGFHMECCTPPLSKMPKGSFVCELCRDESVRKKKQKSGFEIGKTPSRGPGRPPNAQRSLLNSYSATNGQSHTPLSSPTETDEKPHEILSESGQHLLQIPFNKKPKGLIDGMTRFFTPSMGGRKTMTSQARTTQLMIMQRTSLASSSADELGAREDDPAVGKDASTDHKSCKANITELDENMFFRAREESLHRTGVVEGEHPDPSTVRCPESIEFGKYSIETWYSSPYPQEYARLKKLYLCEFCLKYMKSHAILQRHAKKCQWFHPPANEIYRSNELSVFEVDGNVSKIYCQNLCLLAKLFLDHKTLYYDVEPFSFYCLTINDAKGCHLVGYFSKEKHCQQKYNVSCIMTMPQYQRQGYGRFLIDFSYLLSRKEGQAGSPEKPLSDLGQVSYNAYWRSALLEYLSKKTDEKHLSLRDISKSTGICPHDIASTLQKLGMIKVKAPNDESGVAQCRFNLARKRRVVAEYVQKRQAQANDPTRPPRPTLDPDCLRWTPLVASTSFLSDESGLRSPSTTPEKRLPLSPTSRLNFSPASRQPPPPPPPPLPPPTTSQTSEDQPPTSESRSQQQQEDQGTSSDIENVDVGPSPQAAHTPPKHETPPRHDVTARDVTSPSNADIAKGFIPSPIQRKRGRPRKKPLAVAGEGPTGPFAPGAAPRVPAASSGILRSPGRKKRRRKVKGYPWGKVMKKKKKVVDHKEVSDTDMTTGGNGWRLGGPHFSSDSEDEATKEDKTRSEAPSTADAHCSSEVTAQLPEPADIDAEGPLKSHQPDPHPAQLQLAPNVRKRRRRKSKGYQWGAIKRKIKKPLSGALRRVAMGAVVKRNGPGRPKKIVPPPVEPLPAEEERQAADGTPKQPVQTTIHQFFQRKGGVGLTASTNNNNVVSDGSKTLSGDGKALYSALNESKHVVVASVTLTPPKRAPTPGSAELKRKSKKTPFTPPEAEPKQRRKCAIAGENFVASCLLSTRALKKSGVLGTSNEKKRPRGRPRVNFPPQPTPAPEAPRDPKAEDAEQGPSFLGHGPHMQTGEAVRSSLKSSEGTVAFAKLWIPNLGSGASTFSNMSFKAASAHAYKRTSKRFDLQSPSLTTYREMSRAEDDDEDNDNSSSSSSDAESSSCSSAESSDDNSTDEEPMDSRDEEAAHFDKQWREKSRKMLKRKHHEMRQEKSEARAKEQEKANVGALQRRGASKVEGVKRGRGRPRKYPPKEVATSKMKAKKKMRKMEELEMTTAQPEKKPPGLKLTVHRTSGVYHTSHSEDREEGEVEAPIAAEKTLFEEEKIPEEVFTPTDVLQTEEEDAGEPNPPTQFPSPIPEQALSPTNPHHQSSSDSESESSGSEGDSATLRAKEEALRRHGDPTLPTWTSRGVSSSCASTNDAWPDAGSKSPEPRRSPGSINSPGLDDASMGAVFASVADVRPSSAMSDASHAKDEPEGGEPGYAEGNFGDEGDDDESVVGGNSPMTREESPPPATSRPSSTSEEEKEISAAVASITQADAESPMDHQTYQQQNDFALPPQPQKGSPNTGETTKLAPHKDSASGSPDTHNPALNPDLEIEPSPQCPVLEQTPVVSHHDSADRVTDSAHNESSSVYAADAQQPNSDLRAFPPQGCDAAVEEHSAAMACPIPAPAQFNAAQEPQRDPRDFPQACGVEVAAYDGTPMGEIQGGFVAQVRDMSAPEQCQYGSGYSEGGEYAEPMPQVGFQQREMGGSFGSDIYQRPQPQQQQQHAYNANNNPYTETRMFNSSCMADNATPTRLDVIDEGAPPPMMTSPKGGYQQPPPPATTALSQPPAPMAAPCQPVNPIPAQVAHAHGFQGAPNGPGGSGSTSGYETLSNNSCSPYTSPESANPGSCDHTISTTASAQHIEGTYAPAQTSLTGGVSMSVAVQPHPSAPPGVMYSAPSNDSGHGSEYLASPPSHGMSSCQGTPPKPGMTSQTQQQQTMLSPEPYQQARQQQLNSAGSYTNLPSPSLNQAAQNRPSCAVASDSGPIHGPQGVQLMPCMVQQQQRSPAVVKTPTTPQCAFPHAEEAFTSDGGRPQVAPSQELSPSPSRSNTNAVVKLQKLTRDISSHSTSDASTYSTRTTSSAQHPPADAFTPPQIALRRPRYPSTGHPERPASVQPQVVTPMDPCPPPSTPPASLADAPHYAGNPAPGSYGYAPPRSWDPRSGPVARQHPTNAYPGAYEQPYGGGFGGYPGYAATSAPCQFDTQYPNPQTHKLNPGPTYQHNPMLMQPGRQGGFQGPRQADAYGHHGAYGSLAFPPHDARSNLHPTYPAAPPYGGYPPQGQGCYGPNSFPYR